MNILNDAEYNIIKQWDEAVTLGAQGKYQQAKILLDQIVINYQQKCQGTRVGYSLALSTLGSHIRQQGDHARAAQYDRTSLVQSPKETPWARTAHHDGLTGLAADYLGLGNYTESRQLLDHADQLAHAQLADHPSVQWWLGQRLVLRGLWVRCELALAQADPQALSIAEQAMAAATDCPSERHMFKTELIQSAALVADGHVEQGRCQARLVERKAEAAGLMPLAWASSLLLGDNDRYKSYSDRII